VESPPLVTAAPAREVACWLHEPGGELASPARKAQPVATSADG